MSIENTKSKFERVRIQWRSFILGLPGGVTFLRTFVKWREQDIGPHKLTFP